MSGAVGGSDVSGRLARYRALLFAGESTERTVFFSDAVFAIAMTLLVLEVQVPEVPPEELLAALVEEWPAVFGYALSFAAIALTWTNHHTVWRCIGRYTLRLQWINLLMLALVAFLPVPTAVLARSGGGTAVAPIFYALTVAGLELALLWVFAHAQRHGLLVDAVEPDMAHMLRRQLTIPPLVFLLSCPVALVWAPGAFIVWSLVGVAFAVSNRQMRRLLSRHDAADEPGSGEAAGGLSGVGADRADEPSRPGPPADPEVERGR